MNVRLSMVSLVFCCLALGQNTSRLHTAQNASGVSKAGVRYLRPDDFTHVPSQVRSRLNRYHCLIPQDAETAGPHNLISGEFAKQGQQDWAAYCSVQGKSKIMIIWGGASHCEGFDKPVDDKSFYVNADTESMGRTPPPGVFGRLFAVPRAQVPSRQRAQIPLGKLLQSATHDALEFDSILGGSGVYCQDGKWLDLWYAD